MSAPLSPNAPGQLAPAQLAPAQLAPTLVAPALVAPVLVAPWSARRERGSAALVHFMAWLSLRFGWHAARLLVGPIALYFFLASPAARGASRRFLARALGRPARVGERLRHFNVFANVVLDRVFLLTGRDAGYRIDVQGLPALIAALNVVPGQGCILLGAHLGSFEVLRAFGRTSPVPVRPLMYRANAGTFARLLDRLDPSMADHTIELGTPDAMLRVRETLARGELVGILADRAPASGRRPGQRVDFLGAPASFPTAPVLLAAHLGVPVLLFAGIRTGPRAYRIGFVPLAAHVAHDDVPRLVARYARELEALCRVHPFNWFNFHDFWHETANGPGALPAGGNGPGGNGPGGNGPGGNGPGENSGGGNSGGGNSGGGSAA